MARHKFASNVCEKALVCADTETRRTLIEEIMNGTRDNVNPIAAMMKDQYASKFLNLSNRIAVSHILLDYVLQRALTVADVDQKEVLVSKVRPQLANMRRFSSAYTKHLASSQSVVYNF